MSLTAAALLVWAPALAQGDERVDSSVPYHRTFASALAALDAGDNEAAAGGFARAGESAPDAPVWRVHAAVAHLRAGRAEEARVLAHAALGRGYDVSDLAAIEPALVPPDEELARLGRGASEGLEQRLAFVTLHTPRPAPAQPTSSKPAAGPPVKPPVQPGPSVAPGPHVQAVHVRDSDDALFASIGGAWRRLDLQRLQLLPPDGDETLAGWDPWARPKMQPPDTVVRDRIFALVGQRGGAEEVPITRSPKGDAWLYFQTGGMMDTGNVRDVLNVVDVDVTRVVASLGRTTDLGAGPMSFWPPYFSPSGDVLAVSGWWGASLHVFNTHDWSLRFEVPSRQQKGTSGGCDLSLPNDRRLYAVDECGINTHLCEVYDLATGALLFRGEDHGFMTIDGTSDDRIALASSVERPNALVVLDGRGFLPLFDVWLTTGDKGQLVTTARAVDGTFASIPPFARDLVLVGEESFGTSQSALAPWLLDPLHVRSIARDADRAPRPVPHALLRPLPPVAPAARGR